MPVLLDVAALRMQLAAQLDDPNVQAGLAQLARDPFFVAFFLVSVSQGEGLGEAAVGMLGQQELATHIHGLHAQEVEERGHKERTLDTARALFPEHFLAGRYRYAPALDGAAYYVAVLEANRAHLKQAGRYTKLNLYLTTTFGYELMVVLLYREVARHLAGSALPATLRGPVVAVLEGILEEEEGHLGVLDEHEALLGIDPAALSEQARGLVARLARLGPEDYVFAADHSVAEVCRMMAGYAHPAAQRTRIEAQAA